MSTCWTLWLSPPLESPALYFFLQLRNQIWRDWAQCPGSQSGWPPRLVSENLQWSVHVPPGCYIHPLQVPKRWWTTPDLSERCRSAKRGAFGTYGVVLSAVCLAHENSSSAREHGARQGCKPDGAQRSVLGLLAANHSAIPPPAVLNKPDLGERGRRPQTRGLQAGVGAFSAKTIEPEQPNTRCAWSASAFQWLTCVWDTSSRPSQTRSPASCAESLGSLGLWPRGCDKSATSASCGPLPHALRLISETEKSKISVAGHIYFSLTPIKTGHRTLHEMI